jgi:hypothetical protein
MSNQKLDTHRTYRSKLSKGFIPSAAKGLSLIEQKQTQIVRGDVLFLFRKDRSIPILKIFSTPENGSGPYEVEG